VIWHKALAKAEEHFDNWGSRCYLFVNDLKKGEKAIKELSINYDQISKMGGEYIFSLHILPSNTKISLLNKFIDAKDTTIVYKIDNKHND
jgi:hypothetical protein